MSIAPPSPPYHGPPNHHGGRGNRPITRIVIHCTAGAEPGVTGAAKAIARYFRITERYASAHYAADSRESVQCCWDSWVAYHAPPNEHSIGYELCCSLSRQGLGHWRNADHQAMLRIAAADVARLCLAENIPIRRIRAKALRAGERGICGHNDVRDAWGQTSHWDPGPFFPWRKFIRMVREEADRLTTEGDDDMPNVEDIFNHEIKMHRGEEESSTPFWKVIRELEEEQDRQAAKLDEILALLRADPNG